VPARAFPFKPKSTLTVRPGDFWAVPLAGGKFGCGRVIALKRKGSTGSRVMFLGGLLDWIGTASPSAAAIAGCRTVAQAQMHLRSIWETGGALLGHRPLDDDGITPDRFLSQSPGRGCRLMVGYKVLRSATKNEQRVLGVFATWGYLVIRNRAEQLSERQPARRRRRGDTGRP